MLIKLILLALLFYWAGKLIKNLLTPPPNINPVKGNQRKNKPLDLSNYDVEDADFEEVDE